ncbi:MAG: hypothetical protein WA110_02915 [Anaerolineaceae bacterium]
MLSYLVSSLGFIIAMILQYGIVSRIPLLSGTADVILLFVAAWSLHQNKRYSWMVVLLFALIISLISAMPLFLPLIVYMVIFLVASSLKMRVWQTPLLSMFVLTFFGTLFQHGLYLIGLFVQGVSFSWAEVFANIVLPSVLLNMLLAIPVHALVQEMTRNLYPVGLEI